MPRRDKQLRSLELLERDFRDAFIAALEATAQHDLIWCYVTREPESYQAEPWFRARQQTQLLEQVEEIEKVRRALGEPITGTLCEDYRNFCRTLIDTHNDQRLGARRLAQQLLDDLRRTIPT